MVEAAAMMMTESFMLGSGLMLMELLWLLLFVLW